MTREQTIDDEPELPFETGIIAKGEAALVGSVRFRAWNKGKILGQKRALKPREVWAIRVRLHIARKLRDLALFNLAIDSKLRGCDLVKLRMADVFLGGAIRTRAAVIQQKTGIRHTFHAPHQSIADLPQDWEPARSLTAAWPHEDGLDRPLSWD